MVLIKTILSVLSIFTCFSPSQIMATRDRYTDSIDQLEWLREIRSFVAEIRPKMEMPPLGDLNNLIRYEYTRVQCNYMLICYFYLNTTRGLFLSDDAEKNKIFKTDLPNVVSFKTEATKMLATTKNINDLMPDLVEIMWIFHIYLERFSDYLKTAQDLTVLLPCHDAVMLLFEQSFTSNGCLELAQPEDNVRFDDVKTIGESSDDMKNKLRDLVKFKVEVNEQLRHNHLKCGMSITDNAYFDLNSLRLTGVVTDSDLMKTLQELFGLMNGWGEFNEKNVFTYSKAPNDQTLSLYDTLWSMRHLLFNFIQMLKVIMLRIVWELLESAKIVHPLKRPFTIKKFKLRILKIVTNDFMTLLDLHNDCDMKSLVAVLNVSPIVMDLDKTIEVIKERLNIISVKCTPPTDFTKNLIKHEDTKKSQEELNGFAIEHGFYNELVKIPKPIWRAKLFVEYIRRRLIGIHFKTVFNFIRF